MESPESHPLRQKSDLYDPAKYLSAWRDLFFTSSIPICALSISRQGWYSG